MSKEKITLDSLSEKYSRLSLSLSYLKSTREPNAISHHYGACCGFLHALESLGVISLSEEISLCDELNSFVLYHLNL